VGGGELIEQLALHVGASEAVQLLLDLTLQEAAKLFHAFKAERLGEVVIGLQLPWASAPR
jgi:hypothetical protein